MANGTSFEIDIDAPSDSAVVAAGNVDLLAKRLAEAGDAATAASNAVKAGEAAYAAAERTADAAAKAVEKLAIAADTQREKMKAAAEAGNEKAFLKAALAASVLEEKQVAAAEKAAAAKVALVAEASALDKLKASAAQAAQQETALSKAHDAAKKSAIEMKKAQEAAAGSGSFKDLADGAKKLGGPVGRLADVAGDATEGFDKLTGAVGTAGGLYVAAAVAVVALTTAIAAGTVAILKWSIGLVDANRSAQLLSDGIAGTVAGGRELDAAIKSLEKRVPQTSDELRNMAADLAKTGLKGRALTDALENAAVKAAELKWGPDFVKQASSLPKLADRLQANISKVFGGLNIEKLLASFSKLVDLFDETSVTGKAIKVVFESLFQPLIDGLAALGPKIASTFIQFEIWVLKALIAIKPFGSTILTVAKLVGVAALAIGAALAIAAGVIVALSLATAALVGGLVWLGVKFAELVAQAIEFGKSLVSGVGGSFASIQETVNDVIKFLSSISLSAIGTQLVTGLAQGITAGGTAVVSSITGVVDGAIMSAKKLLKISSPSKVFEDIGANTAAGMVSGVEGGTSQVQGSMESLVAPPSPEASAVSATGASGGNTINITINAPGGDAPSIAAAVREAVLDFFEGGEIQVGAAVPA